MKLATTIVAIALSIGLPGVVRDASAQAARDQPGIKNFDPHDIAVDENSDLHAALTRQYELADLAIKNYIQQSVQAIQEGHRVGFQHFAVWYRNYENAKKSSADAIAQELFKQLLPLAFKAIFPEAKDFIETMTKVVEGTIAVGEKALTGTEGDINLFLEKLRSAEELQISKLLDLPKQYVEDHHDQYMAAVLEYIDIRLQDPKLLRDDVLAARAADKSSDPTMKDLPASVTTMLTNFGVPQPGSKTATQVAEGVLEYHILDIMQHDDNWKMIWPYSEKEFARAHALFEMDPVGNKARICQAMRSWTYFRIFKPDDCAPLLR
jgi:hypothetical protein